MSGINYSAYLLGLSVRKHVGDYCRYGNDSSAHRDYGVESVCIQDLNLPPNPSLVETEHRRHSHYCL